MHLQELLDLEKATPAAMDNEQRVQLATKCHDADAVPKVPDAGAVKFRPDGTRVQVMHNGLEVLADGYYGEWMTRLIELCKGHHEPQEEVIFHEVVKHLPATAHMLELGSFWGYYTLWFLQGHPDRKAIALEPDPAHLLVGETNARLNGLQPHFLAGAVNAEPSEGKRFRTEESGEVVTRRFSVPQIMTEWKIDLLDLLHCDTQGAELAVLGSCAELFLNNRISWVFVSTHAHQISNDPLTHQRCLAFLKHVGGSIVVEHDVHESYSGDGLIVARFGTQPLDWTIPVLSRNRYSESYFRNPLYDLAQLLKRQGVESS